MASSKDKALEVYAPSVTDPNNLAALLPGFTDSKSKELAVQAIGPRAQLTCQQLVDVLNQLPQSGSKDLAVSVLGPRVVDKSNAGMVMNALPLQGSREKAEQYLR